MTFTYGSFANSVHTKPGRMQLILTPLSMHFWPNVIVMFWMPPAAPLGPLLALFPGVASSPTYSFRVLDLNTGGERNERHRDDMNTLLILVCSKTRRTQSHALSSNRPG